MKYIFKISIVFLAFVMFGFGENSNRKNIATNSISLENCVEVEKTFADLSPHEKKEAITHMLANGECSWKGISLHGKVKVVDAFPDIKVQFVNAFPDIKVKWVNAFPNDCGEWQKVNAFPDFTIQIVDAFPDLKVKEVSSFPGMN